MSLKKGPKKLSHQEDKNNQKNLLDIGNLFIVAAPSGGGKTSLVRQVAQRMSDVEISISHTTRPQRVGEHQGKDYYFVTEQVFQSMIDQQLFLEYAKVFDNYYGTSIQQLRERLVRGVDVLLDIDWQGARLIKKLFPKSVSVFLLPPSLDVLQQRLHTRQREDREVIEQRMAKAHEELSHYEEFDYLIVNHDFNMAADELMSIIIANRLTLERQSIQQHKLLSILQAKE